MPGPVRLCQRRWPALVLLALALARPQASRAEALPLRHLLFDFETGIEGWVGNPWGGGQCGPEASTDARFGRGCLRGWYRDVERGATVICPYFAADARWRGQRWGQISFHFRGDGSTGEVSLYLETDEAEHSTYSRSVALEDTSWHRVSLPLATFWNRGGKDLDPTRLRRLYFGGRGTCQFWADQLALEAASREVPVLPEGDTELRPPAAPAGTEPVAPSPVWLDFGQGRYGARFDPLRLAGQATKVELLATLELAGQAYTGSDRLEGAHLGSRELLAALDERVTSEGDARLTCELRVDDQAPRAVGTGRYQVFLPSSPVPRVAPPFGIVPAPKEVQTVPGVCRLPRHLAVAALGPEAVDARVLALLRSELERWYGIRVESAPSAEAAQLVLIKRPAALAESVWRPFLPAALAEWLRSPQPEAYALTVAPERVVLAAAEDAGLYDAAQSLLQALDANTSVPAEPVLPCGTIRDWPSLRVRALSMVLPTDRWGHPNNAPVDVGFFCEFIRRQVARYKINAIALGLNAGYEFGSRPEIACPSAWGKSELQEVIRTCRDHFIEVFPVVNSYGHTGWLTLNHKELREDGELNILCVRQPEAFAILTDLYAELLEVFAPVRYFHIGMDEVWWKTLAVPPEKRCCLCAGVPKSQLLAEHVVRLHAWLKARGVQTILWGDMLLPEHNGGAPFHSAAALAQLPADLTIANWSTSLAPDSNARFGRRGSRVWQANSLGVNREQAQYCEGNMFGVWTKTPWWGDAPWREGQAFNYLAFSTAAEYSWNPWPEIETLEPRLDRAWLRSQECGLLARDALQPEPMAGAETFTVGIEGNHNSTASDPPRPEHWFGATAEADLRNLPRGNVTVAGLPFDLPRGERDCLAPPLGESVVVKVNRTAASLRFLHTACVPAAAAAALAKEFEKAANWAGIPIGRYTIVFSDGTTDACPVLYNMNVGPWHRSDGRLPYVYRAVGFLRTASNALRRTDGDALDICLYVAQWVNPQPAKTIVRVELTGSDLATPVLFAVTGRGLRQDLGPAP